ncbi:RcpC/CpaB family pilus assembly protein [Kineosporia rhizophila]|uniref:RcpC/CpaB family pilus assembly protein n=1 Tax=Kineosporia rhizophila TaxID=84633 RepID=UPI001E335BC8|nr:RcpC/CpaB family pilus assembly protein [Kineosporia rhizophila]MCE0539226.1 RcpC/CpaB family pilus assembly protein [Kineosporia rhizophila]
MRLLGPGLLQGLPAGTVAVPVRLTDPAGSALVRAGQRVDVLASTASTWSAEEGGGSSTLSPATTRRAARNALVLSTSGQGNGARAWEEDAGGTGGGWAAGSDDAAALAGVLVLAVPESEVTQLVGAVTGAQVSVVVLS